ncbi:tenascin-like isoform X6 [Pomacea canaliculata]|uniref:tenascin-like isoform X6 n=1 Tax=Pomacea canaliculata TaxID=400727 RepID=UPI000D72C7F1|nr:tenascin-like isoform X6 [Pomacea canaliculata]
MHWSLLYFTYVWWEELARSCCEHRCCRSCTSCMCGGRGLYADVSIAAVVGSSLSPGIYLPLDTCRLPAVVNLSSSQTLLSSGYPATNSILTKTISGWIQMLRFLLFLLCVSRVLAKDTERCQGKDCEIKTWHNKNCRTNDDCNQPLAVCYENQCRCDPGYYYTTNDTCTSTCSTGELQSNFTEYPDSAIRGNHLDRINGISLEYCKGRCQTLRRCLTFDFKANGGQCRFHNVTAREAPSDWSPKTSTGWTHYQRSCKSTLATDDNWYNLLCNSRINCPDPNSDCLSGRCFCQLGFNFNEAMKKCVTSVLKTWHNASCGTDDDCDEPHGVCYKRVCRCHPGYYYTTQDTCTSTCSRGELQSNFTEYPDSALRGNHLASSDRVSVDVCKGRCLADNRCLTFDFKGHGGLCRLHHVTALESSSDWSPKTSKGWTHYQRSCKSPFASNDTWYNLLCDSKIACPDRNSDCLSGRCMCHSGFKFNEATKKCVVTSELKTWHNTSCGTDDDCDEPHGVCYKHLCRCHPGYYYTTQDTCTSTCSRGECRATLQSIQTALYVETTLLARMESVWMSARAGAWPTIVASPLTSKPMEVSVGFIM